jgi:ElaB/YqjD/DUF883 family membrane-anchored ribosome-binding protein
METTKKENKEPNKPAVTTGGSMGGGSAVGSSTSPTTTSSAAQTVRDEARDLGRQASDFADQTKQAAAQAYDKASRTASEAYDKTSQTLSASYDQAMVYGRDNPGKLTLIAFGAGIGVGILLAGGFSTRSRSSRIVPPVVDALSEIAREVFR